MGKILDSTLSWIFEKMAKAYVHRTGNSLADAKVPVVQEDGGKPYFNLSSIGSADLSKLSGANALDGTIAEAISGLCRVIEVPDSDELNSLYGTTGTITETYLKNAHRWLNENRESLRLSPLRPYVLELWPNGHGIGLYYTYATSGNTNNYNAIYYFSYSEFVYGGYNGGVWKFGSVL